MKRVEYIIGIRRIVINVDDIEDFKICIGLNMQFFKNFNKL